MYSFRKSQLFWLRSNVVLLLFSSLLLINKPYWNNNGSGTSFFLFVFIAECFLIILALVYGFQTKKGNARQSLKTTLLKSNIIVGVFVFSVFSLFFGFILSSSIPYPSSILIVYLIVNMIFAFASLLFPTVVIKLYESNVYDETKGLIPDFFRYVAILVSSLNYEVQKVLARLPFILQRILGIVFILVLICSIAGALSVFEN
ncbi:hypothetical protein BTA31_12805 [Bacillus haynesii]|uniref:ABC transporter permease n=1 Tax=Bacillus haynesii TaxID=1925021 RepID=A0ABX3I2M3_9BACI|nr:hypothetical protein [Bacillus haynesii]OMI27041.1 hypothetical protein BTA31_12805 [Bacillus haynesii]